MLLNLYILIIIISVQTNYCETWRMSQQNPIPNPNYGRELTVERTAAENMPAEYVENVDSKAVLSIRGNHRNNRISRNSRRGLKRNNNHIIPHSQEVKYFENIHENQPTTISPTMVTQKMVSTVNLSEIKSILAKLLVQIDSLENQRKRGSETLDLVQPLAENSLHEVQSVKAQEPTLSTQDHIFAYQESDFTTVRPFSNARDRGSFTQILIASNKSPAIALTLSSIAGKSQAVKAPMQVAPMQVAPVQVDPVQGLAPQLETSAQGSIVQKQSPITKISHSPKVPRAETHVKNSHRFLDMFKSKDKEYEGNNEAKKVKWGDWTDWSACSVSCGKGREIRWRHCKEDCDDVETEMEEKACQLPACGPGKLFGMINI